MKQYYYNFGWHVVGTRASSTTVVLPKHSLAYYNLATLAHKKGNIPAPQLIYIDDAGWHCSYCMTVQEIQRKINAFSHVEYAHPPYNTLEWISEKVASGGDMYDRSAIVIYKANQTSDLPEVLFQADHLTYLIPWMDVNKKERP